MANNRFQIYCKKCLEMDTFGHYFPDPKFSWAVNPLTVSILNDFFEKHQKSCYADKSTYDVQWGEDMFGIRTEQAKDGYFCDYSKRPFKLLSN